MQGYEDPNYMNMFKATVKSIPMDDTIQILLQDQTTIDWNPLIFAIFYGNLDIVSYLIENRANEVYVRNCLTSSFIIDTYGEDQDSDIDMERFISEKTEIFSLVLCIMQRNKLIFEFLWEKCCFIWNDIHLVLLVNFLFEAQWMEGMKILFNSKSTH